MKPRLTIKIEISIPEADIKHYFNQLTPSAKYRSKTKTIKMATLTGINTRMKGSVGDWTFSQVGGQTVVKQKPAKKQTPVRTFAIMRRRVQWKNIQNIYSAFEGRLRPSFEGRAANVSDYNEFISANIDLVPVYLTKTEARANAAVVAPYQLTRGSLLTVEHTMDVPGKVVTDIGLGDLTVDGDTSVADFSRAVVTNSEAYAFGDQISVFVLHQLVNPDSGIPYVVVKAYEVTLSVEDESAMLSSLVDINYFKNIDGKLGNSAVFTGGIAYVHSRKTPSGTKVSTQRVVVNSSTLAAYQTRAALDKAVLSYGGLNEDHFLTPNDPDEVAPVRP